MECSGLGQDGADDQAPARFFCGRFDLVLDDKGRLTILSAFRKVLGDRVYLRKNRRDRCIDIVPEDTWCRFLKALRDSSALDPNVQRLSTVQAANSVATTIDKSGRVLIPVAMKEGAGITSSSVVLTGANDRLKVWEPSVWAELERQADEEDLEARVFEKYQL